MIFLIWTHAVFLEMLNSFAISVFGKPRPISRINSRSRGVGDLYPNVSVIGTTHVLVHFC
jgi:hypothetical protein